MRYGICCGLENISKLEKYGYDYIEPMAVSIAAMDEKDYRKTLYNVNNSSIKCEAFNVLFPGTAKIIGNDADHLGASEYIKALFPKLKALGGEIVVFGSGGVRRIPEDFNIEQAYTQLCEISLTLGEAAYNNGLTVVIEPLCKSETNLINTLSEGAAVVKDVNHPNFALLTDWYHNKAENETGADIKTFGKYLRHAHIAMPGERKNPSENDGGEYEDFFNALSDTGYDARLSCEGHNFEDFDSYARDMLEYLKSIYKNKQTK